MRMADPGMKWLSFSLIAFVWSFATIAAGDELFFRATSVLQQSCLQCHNAKDKAGGLSLANLDDIRRGGDSGSVVDESSPKESRLIELIRSGEMPPPANGKSRALSPADTESIEKWIQAKLPWEKNHAELVDLSKAKQKSAAEWWAFKPITQPELNPEPTVDLTTLENPVDLLAANQRVDSKLKPAPIADREVLIRRLYFDLIGYPPTEEQIAEFNEDRHPAAYDRLVDQLLASPHFGERWARHWLDVVRYAETNGYERDAEKPNAWRYRDWVIESFNADKPFSEFLTEQLAGDEVEQKTEETVVATGLLRLGTWDDEPNDALDYQYERIEDLVDVVSQGFLGLTTKCARCHDHKFDPIKQTEYYSLASAFWAGPIKPRGRELLGGPTKEELGFDVLGWTDLSNSPPPMKILEKGDPHREGAEVQPRFLNVASPSSTVWPKADTNSNSTRWRTQLARDLLRDDNPLTYRVIANRLWLHHFGQGLSRTPNNFGVTGDSPKHVELIDYLATRLRENGGSLKLLHRELVLSNTYRLSSIHPEEVNYQVIDPENRYLWKANRRRRDAESIRDSLLASTSELNLQMKGESFRPRISGEALEGLSQKSAAWRESEEVSRARRAVYMYSKRSLIDPLMTTFDFCDTTKSCGQRDQSTVPNQALTLLNNPFAHERAAKLSANVQEAVADPAERIEKIWIAVYGRKPSNLESQLAAEHLQEQDNLIESSKSHARSEVARVSSWKELESSMRLWLDVADAEVSGDGGLEKWLDRSPSKMEISQVDVKNRPRVVRNEATKRMEVQFDGKDDFLKVSGKVLSEPTFSIFAVARDDASARGNASHRELFSNWNGGAGNSGSSVFLGLTEQGRIRFSDDYSVLAEPKQLSELFLLEAHASSETTSIFLNGAKLGSKGPLSTRKFEFDYVLGTQGNIGGEYWDGALLEMVVLQGNVGSDQLEAFRYHLLDKYAIPYSETKPAEIAADPYASLIMVLFNSNEFIYVD